METLTITKHEKNYSSLVHLSAFTKFIIPLGNYIVPFILWSTKKKESSFIDYNGKQILNFQLSILMYSIFLGILAIPTIIGSVLSNFTWSELQSGNIVLDNIQINNLIGLGVFGVICGALFVVFKVVEFFYIIYGAIKANEGEYFKYPLTINFIK